MAKPKSAGLLAILGAPKGDSGEGGGDEDEARDIEISAMEDFLAGVKAEDPAAMKEAFKRAYDACAGKAEDEGGEEY